MNYNVWVQEVCSYPVYVEATTKEEAREKVHGGEGRVVTPRF